MEAPGGEPSGEIPGGDLQGLFVLRAPNQPIRSLTLCNADAELGCHVLPDKRHLEQLLGGRPVIGVGPQHRVDQCLSRGEEVYQPSRQYDDPPRKMHSFQTRLMAEGGTGEGTLVFGATRAELFGEPT